MGKYVSAVAHHHHLTRPAASLHDLQGVVAVSSQILGRPLPRGVTRPRLPPCLSRPSALYALANTRAIVLVIGIVKIASHPAAWRFV